ncbi:Ribosomal RNA small subunit methyltransferase E [Clavibacter michiganensis subsp. michiganensis]|uniref:Ribosomal RNA small subunit methyltransferase E n=1 Tax=Clavibacter michiganensis subsp. michiganensis TaxID=33013 RepID=A0A251XCV1_CLAMM|nr:Ribosomal RNA small subunit methyltransferase E [Clavibacter michiganensis subsp. michiganensis]OUD99841.1 Ribosomal RNA small subunit methyltransferase E [Clavibacter michiganensis subsp. michiganensis]
MVLVQALAKGDRDELAVQAATELGVDAVIPWQAQRSVSRWEGQKVAKGRDRWRAIVREAVKQSIRPRVPEVEALATTKDLVRMAATARVLVLDPTAVARLSRLDLATADGDAGPATDVLLVVGPRAESPPRRSSRCGRRGRSRSRSARGSSARRPRAGRAGARQRRARALVTSRVPRRLGA